MIPTLQTVPGYVAPSSMIDLNILAVLSFIWGYYALPSGGGGAVFWTWWVLYLSGSGQIDTCLSRPEYKGVRNGASHGLMWGVMLPMMVTYTVVISIYNHTGTLEGSESSVALLWAFQFHAVYESFLRRRGRGNLTTTVAVPLFFAIAFWRQGYVYPISLWRLIIALLFMRATDWWNDLNNDKKHPWFKGSFTIGEAGVVAAGIGGALLDLLFSACCSSERSVEGIIGISAVMGTMFALRVSLPHFGKDDGKSWFKAFASAALVGVMPVTTILSGGSLTSVSWVLTANPFVVVLGRVFGSFSSFAVVIWDGAVVAGTIYALTQDKAIVGGLSSKTPLPILRKVFHALIVAVAVPIILVDPVLAGLAGAAALSTMMVLEAARVGKMGGTAGKGLMQFMGRFVDSRDGGQVYLTHMYLLIGVMGPVWISNWAGLGDALGGHSLVAFAGVICLGVGDTAASIVGVKYGKTLIKSGSSKTWEGTAGGAVGNIVALLVLSLFTGWSFGFGQWLWLILSCCGIAIAEAVTDQIDNLMLPALFAAMLSVI